jgi:hypothetical protein
LILAFDVAMLAQEQSLISTQIAESQESPTQRRVELTGMYFIRSPLIPDKRLSIFFCLVLRVHNVPRIKNLFGLKLFVTVASQDTKKKTSSISTKGSTVEWNENLGAL